MYKPTRVWMNKIEAYSNNNTSLDNGRQCRTETAEKSECKWKVKKNNETESYTYTVQWKSRVEGDNNDNYQRDNTRTCQMVKCTRYVICAYVIS